MLRERLDAVYAALGSLSTAAAGGAAASSPALTLVLSCPKLALALERPVPLPPSPRPAPEHSKRPIYNPGVNPTLGVAAAPGVLELAAHGLLARMHICGTGSTHGSGGRSGDSGKGTLLIEASVAALRMALMPGSGRGSGGACDSAAQPAAAGVDLAGARGSGHGADSLIGSGGICTDAHIVAASAFSVNGQHPERIAEALCSDGAALPAKNSGAPEDAAPWTSWVGSAGPVQLLTSPAAHVPVEQGAGAHPAPFLALTWRVSGQGNAQGHREPTCRTCDGGGPHPTLTPAIHPIDDPDGLTVAVASTDARLAPASAAALVGLLKPLGLVAGAAAGLAVDAGAAPVRGAVAAVASRAGRRRLLTEAPAAPQQMQACSLLAPFTNPMPFPL